jgi:two-component system OmpR family response regulator
MENNTPPIRILLVEDDSNLGSLLQEYLNAKGFEASIATDGKAGLEAYLGGDFDLCILDVMMPQKDGYTLAREIRASNQDIPIIFLTAKSMREDTIEGFHSGADDYMTKPFSMEELLLRIKAIMKRSRLFEDEEDKTEFSVGNTVFNYNTQLLQVGEKEQKLTTKENQLLKILFTNHNQVLTRETALKMIWGDNNYFNARSMDVYITKLRKYLREEEMVEIMNVHGQGFKLYTKEPLG